MKLQGQHVKSVRWIHAGPCVVRVEVDAVIPVDDPTEPCFEPETIQFLRQVHERAVAGDVNWLKDVGDVYVRLSA